MSQSSRPALSALFTGRWEAVVAELSRTIDLEATARQFKAIQRVRKIRSAADLLRLAMIWGPGRQSYRESAALAAHGKIVAMSDKGIVGRMRKAGDWLAHILASLLAARAGRARGAALDASVLDVSVIDGSVICSPGKGENWRLHARYDAGQGRFSDLVLTTARHAECASRTPAQARQVTLMDRGYARLRSFQAVLREGGDFIARIGWRQLVFHDAKKQRIDLMALLRRRRLRAGRCSEHAVWLKGIERPLRLIIQPLPPEIAARQRARRARTANKKSHKLDPRTAETAGFLMLVTSLPVRGHSTRQVLDRYPDRWQVEIGFKRCKTLGGIDALPAADPDLARTWLLAHLIAAVLIDDLVNEIVAFPP
jgi:Transposase DDE domain